MSKRRIATPSKAPAKKAKIEQQPQSWEFDDDDDDWENVAAPKRAVTQAPWHRHDDDEDDDDDNDFDDNQSGSDDDDLASGDDTHGYVHQDTSWDSNQWDGGGHNKSQDRSRSWGDASYQDSHWNSDRWNKPDYYTERNGDKSNRGKGKGGKDKDDKGKGGKGKGRKDGKGKGKGRDDDAPTNFGIKLSGVPCSYDHETLVELHESTGLDITRFESSKVEAQGAEGTCTVVCRYSDKKSAQNAAQELNGQLVADDNDNERELSAFYYESQGVSEVLPSVYISDLPVHITEDELRQIHTELGMDGDKLASVKFLASKDPSGETCCCIGRYRDDESAQAAIVGLKGHRVQTSSGVFRFLGARMAKPAGWMVQTGQADKQMQAYQESRKESRKSGSNKWLSEGEKAPTGSFVKEGEIQNGTIKKWFSEKGFGFIAIEGAADIFLHAKEVMDGVPFFEGERVVFKPTWDEPRNRYTAQECHREGSSWTGPNPASEQQQQQQPRVVPPPIRSGSESDGTDLLIKGLPEDISEEDLSDMFASHGEVESCKVLYRTAGQTAAIVKMRSSEAAEQALVGYNGLALDGACASLVVTRAKK